MSWRSRNPEKSILIRAKHRAKRDQIVFDLSVEDIQIPETCPVLGIKLKFGADRFLDSPSLDRINPEKGYVKDNVKVISGRANILKRDATLLELKQLVSYLEQCQCAS